MNGELVKRIARSFVQQDEKEFNLAMRQLISSEREQGHDRLADELAKILNGIGSQARGPRRLQTSVSPSPSGGKDNMPLIDVREAVHRLDEMILSEQTETQVLRFLEEYRKRDQLARFGLKPRMKLLFFGPPGNGKTFCAEVVAAELGLALFYVRFDSLVASYLGETSANLRRVFDFATSHLGVVLFDEFDAIGKSRDDHEEVGELKRVVNSFLQMLDNYSGTSPIIAATNYEKLLDYALWRRFDSLIFFPQATEDQLVRYLGLRLSSIPSEDVSPVEAAKLCAGMSYADVARALTDAVKSMVLSDERTLRYETLRREIQVFKEAQRRRDARSQLASEGRNDG